MQGLINAGDGTDLVFSRGRNATAICMLLVGPLPVPPPPRPAPSPVAAVAVNNAPRAYGRRKARDRNAVRAGSGDIQEAKSRLAGKKEKGEPRKRAWDRRRIFRKSVIGMNAERKARARAHTQRERERERERENCSTKHTT